MFNIFDTRFEVIEYRNSGAKITHYLKGSNYRVKRDVEMFKKKSRAFIVNGRKKMTIWS